MNYDSVFKTKDIISKDRARFARAWNRYFGNWGDRGGPTEEEAFNAWFEMINKDIKHTNKLKYLNIQNILLKNLNPSRKISLDIMPLA